MLRIKINIASRSSRGSIRIGWTVVYRIFGQRSLKLPIGLPIPVELRQNFPHVLKRMRLRLGIHRRFHAKA
jgi:hypothetical protein